MHKKELEIKCLNQVFIKIAHKTGLTIFFKKMEGFSSSVAVFVTKFGSTDCRLKTKDEDIEIFDGTAHYLEHKLFENENSDITFELFSNEKALANAQTSFDYTSYYFSSPCENFLNALKILLNFVQTPYFTEENVEKERGIISQEIKMNEDEPYWVTFFNCLDSMYEKSAIKKKIAGSEESIKKIDRQLLYKCYDNFYCLNNMALIIAGNFNEEEVFNLIDKELKPTKNIDVKRHFEDEPYEVKNKYFETHMSIQTPIFSIGFKLKPISEEDVLKFKIGFKIVYELFFGEGSILYKYFYDNQLVVGGEIDCDIVFGIDYFALILTGESENPKRVLEKISQEIEKQKANQIDEKEFILVKKTVYKDLIKEMSRPEKMAEFLADSFVENYSFGDLLEIAAKFTIADLKNVIKALDVNNISLSVTLPLPEINS